MTSLFVTERRSPWQIAAMLLRSLLAALMIMAIASCGGGGSGSNGGPVGGGNPPPPPPPPPPPAVNRAPVFSLPIALQRAIQLHPFDFDVTQAGRTFTDPDGDTITYTVTHNTGGVLGLRIEGSRIVGIPEATGFVQYLVQADDGRGAVSAEYFTIRVDPNAVPTRAADFDDMIVAIGAGVDYDATRGGTAFTDADGDPLTYQVAVRGAPGISVTGARVQGALTGVGATEVKITVRDGFGGEAVEHFLIAAPGPLPGAPTASGGAYAYEDRQLAFPQTMGFEFALNLLDPETNPPTNAGASLGRVLFHDKRLSITNTVSCASCHQQSHGFASPHRFDTGVLGVPLNRNAMTLTNARVSSQNRFFSDMRAVRVRGAVRDAIVSRDELGSRLPHLEAKLRAAAFYEPLFTAAFGTPGVTADRAVYALEQYVQTILAYRSRFDRVCLPMDNSPIDCSGGFTAQELRGQEIFETNIAVPCALCHARWNTTNTWHANNGLDDVPADVGATDPQVQRNGALGVFRAGSLRNIARTGPYMHDGRFSTLRQVIDHYDHGIRLSPNLDFILGDTLTGRVGRLNLSEADKDALEAFLNTFTDEEMLSDPKFSDPF